MQKFPFTSDTSVYLLGIDKTKSLGFSVLSYSNLSLNTTLSHDSSLSLLRFSTALQRRGKGFYLPTESGRYSPWVTWRCYSFMGECRIFPKVEYLWYLQVQLTYLCTAIVYYWLCTLSNISSFFRLVESAKRHKTAKDTLSLIEILQRWIIY